MKSVTKQLLCLILVLLSVFSYSFGQQKVNQLYQYGIAPAFLGGLYQNGVPVSGLARQGSFGIAGPSLLDGELIQIDGKIYQTHADGQTVLASDNLLIPFGMVCFFRPDTAFKVFQQITKPELEKKIDSCLKNKNGIYAIRISGVFKGIQTRAFHAVSAKPWPPIEQVQSEQQIFKYDDIKGLTFGYRMPPYMLNISGAGYHAHFLSADRHHGGHVTDYVADQVTVEIALIKSVTIGIPQDNAFSNFKTK
jgi:acetolactate decarboxylase